MVEADPKLMKRAVALIRDINSDPEVTRLDVLAAYQAVILKDLLTVQTEMLIYKQQEVHR